MEWVNRFHFSVNDEMEMSKDSAPLPKANSRKWKGLLNKKGGQIDLLLIYDPLLIGMF